MQGRYFTAKTCRMSNGFTLKTLNKYRDIYWRSTASLMSTSTATTSTAPTAATSNLIEIFVDGKSVKVEPGSVLIEACTKSGAEIPRFCYHERLAIAGNCRMCLVEVEKSPKPVASCAMPVMPGMKVWTGTDMVKKAREGVMEFLLANHPLDCPICDQGGECDLQDQSTVYGSDRGRFCETSVGKRAVEDKDFGPLVKTTMTRCIHCTRCVRFAVDVAGLDSLGTSGRGQDMEIGTYVEKTLLDSELSGNIIDLCPVGALTNKPYAFKARPWELKSTESIDVMDAFGANIRVDSRGMQVMRVLPRENDELNEAWLGDKSRFACDGLNRQRITRPLLRTTKDNFIEISWEKALGIILHQLSERAGTVAGIVGAMADLESMVALRDLVHRLGSEHLYVDGNFGVPFSGFTDFRANYLYNTGIRETECATSVLMIGVDPRHESPLLNLRLRKAYLKGASIGMFGPKLNLNYDYELLGNSPADVQKHFSNLKEGSFINEWLHSENPMLILGSGLFEEEHSRTLVSFIKRFIQTKAPRLVRPEWNGLNVLQREASRVGALDLGYSTKPLSSNDATPIKVIYLLQADAVPASSLPSDAFVIYQGHHGDHGASLADLVLPGACYTEKDATFINLEGRPQRTKAAVPPPQDARTDWHIIRAISEALGLTLGYQSDVQLRTRIGQIIPHALETFVRQKLTIPLNTPLVPSKPHILSGLPFHLPIQDYYLSDPISRASTTMAKCSKAFIKERKSIDSL